MTLHERMDGSSGSSKRSQYGQKNVWPVATTLFKTTVSGVLKKILKLFSLQRFDASNRSSEQ